MSGSIWDAPVPVGADARQTYGAHGVDTLPVQQVPVIPAGNHLFGQEAGPLLTAAGRGVVNGVPYGETLRQEQADLQRQYLLRPGAYAALRAQTRQALGR